MNWLKKLWEFIKVSYLKRHMMSILEDIERLDFYIRSHNYQNEQWFIEWQDDLNKVSVR
jgi:hypothetical protein